MTLHEVPAEAVVEPDRPFEIDRITVPGTGEARAGDGLVRHVGLPPVVAPCGDRQAAAVDGDRIAETDIGEDVAGADAQHATSNDSIVPSSSTMP